MTRREPKPLDVHYTYQKRWDYAKHEGYVVYVDDDGKDVRFEIATPPAPSDHFLRYPGTREWLVQLLNRAYAQGFDDGYTYFPSELLKGKT